MLKGKEKRERESRQQADELLDPAYPAYCVADDQQFHRGIVEGSGPHFRFPLDESPFLPLLLLTRRVSTRPDSRNLLGRERTAKARNCGIKLPLLSPLTVTIPLVTLFLVSSLEDSGMVTRWQLPSSQTPLRLSEFRVLVSPFLPTNSDPTL